MTQQARVRRGRAGDAEAIRALYTTVSLRSGGLAHSADEIDAQYVRGFLANSLARGVILVAELPDMNELAGELHTYRSDLRLFRHVLGDLTVAVHPDTQGQGIGRLLFTRLLEEVAVNHPDVTRIELVTQESNVRALRLYESLGFRREGRMEGRIRTLDGGVEADIPLAWLRP